MGVCINYAIGIEKQHIENAINEVHELAKNMQEAARAIGIKYEIHSDDKGLIINIGGCESVVFEFKAYRDMKTHGDDWERVSLLNKFSEEMLEKSPKTNSHLAAYPGQELLWCDSFTKTQYAGALVEHRMVADLVRCMAKHARFSYVYDEGDYYHTGNIDDAQKAIDETQKVMSGIIENLQKGGWKTN